MPTKRSSNLRHLTASIRSDVGDLGLQITSGHSIRPSLIAQCLQTRRVKEELAELVASSVAPQV